MKRRLWLHLLATSLLGACASQGPQTGNAPSFWSGRLGLQVFSEPPQSLHASFELRGGPEVGELSLFSPLGGTLATLQWQPGQAVLMRGTDRWLARTPTELGQRMLNTPVPLTALFAWLAGQEVRQDGWQVDLRQWSEGRILAQRMEPLPAATLRIVLER